MTANILQAILHLTATGMFPPAASDIRHVVSFSGGAGSWAAAKRVAEAVPVEQITLLFADTIIEDQDTYRFLIEGAADVLGVPRPDGLMARALALPELSIDDPHCLARKPILADLRRDAMTEIPGLVWIADGRHPWEVFEDVRFIGNSQTDPCSSVLKRKLINAWRDRHCPRDATICYVGIDWSERHRFNDMLPLVKPWRYEAPMCEPPYMSKAAVLAWLESCGIRNQRLYELAFPHANCGAYCCKAGMAHFAHLRKMLPGRFAWHEHWENRLRDIVGDYSMLADRRGGGPKRPQPLSMLRERMEAGESFANEEWGGCGCALPSPVSLTGESK